MAFEAEHIDVSRSLVDEWRECRAAPTVESLDRAHDLMRRMTPEQREECGRRA